MFIICCAENYYIMDYVCCFSGLMVWNTLLGRKLNEKTLLYSWIYSYNCCVGCLLHISLSSSFVINNVPFIVFGSSFFSVFLFHIYKHYICIIVYCFSRLFLFICFHSPFIMFWVFRLCLLFMFPSIYHFASLFISLFTIHTLSYLHTHTLTCYNINEV